MAISTFRNILLALIVTSTSWSVASAMTCQEALSGKEPWYTSLTSRFNRAKNFARSYTKLLEVDPRLASLKLVKYSSTLDRVDNLSSPALMTNVILGTGRFTEAQHAAFESARQTTSTVVPRLLESGIELSPIQRNILEQIEAKFRLATFVLYSAAKEVSGSTFLRDSIREQYFDELTTFTTNVLNELLQNKATRKLFEQPIIDGIERALTEASPKEFEARREALLEIEFPGASQISLVNILEVNSSFGVNLRNVGEHLSAELANLPIGISIRPIEATSTVRLGANHYYGNYHKTNGYQETSRQGYERGNPRIGGWAASFSGARGVVDAELNVSNRKKKLMAVLIDQTHRSLDPAEPLPDIPSRCMHTCGSYPFYMFWRSGVPVVTPTYFLAEWGMASLALQRLIGLPNVKKVSFNNFTAKGALVALPIFYFHGIAASKAEAGIYLWVISRATGMAFLANLLW